MNNKDKNGKFIKVAVDIDQIVELYVNQKLTVEKVADILGLGSWTVRDRLFSLGMLRSHSDAGKLMVNNTGQLKKGSIPWNKGKCLADKIKNKISLKHKGKHFSPKTEFKKGHGLREKNNKWNGGIGIYRKILAENNIDCTKCVICESTHKIIVHHKDGNRHNNELKNLIVLCTKCHFRIHNIKFTENDVINIKADKYINHKTINLIAKENNTTRDTIRKILKGEYICKPSLA